MVARLLAVGLLVALGAVIGQQAFTGYVPVWNQGRYSFISITELRDALDIQVPQPERIDYPILTTSIVDVDVAAGAGATNWYIKYSSENGANVGMNDGAIALLQLEP